MASGSTLGSDTGTSRVATDFTQSVDPDSGTTSTSRPSCLKKPILVATANGDPTPVVIVRAHVATRSFVVWAPATSGRHNVSATTSDAMRIMQDRKSTRLNSSHTV